MNLKNLIKDAVAKEAAGAIIGKTLPVDAKKGVSKGKMTLGALVVAVGALLFEYFS